MTTGITLNVESTPVTIVTTASGATISNTTEEVSISATNEEASLVVQPQEVVVLSANTIQTQVVSDVSVEILTVAEQGPPGVGSDIVLGEELNGVINGSNATFTTDDDFLPGSVVVRVNGLAQRLITDFQTSGTNTIIFSDSPQPGDYLAADYERA